MHIPEDGPTIQERPECDMDERVDEPNALRRHTGSGGQVGDEDELGQDERDRTRESGEAESHSTQKPPRDDGDERDIETNAPGRDPGGGSRVQVQDRSGDVEGDWDRQSDGDGIVFDWIRDQMDGAASDVRNGSKRADTKSLAMERRGQHGRRTHLGHPYRPTITGVQQLIRSRRDVVEGSSLH